ncbi:hypothetical protein BDZ89DRAFT_550872 [Hymenopellis radicata]|nr:hypothetical protein BDZ89DRAFT_550872 [Hymenopellis radicata]
MLFLRIVISVASTGRAIFMFGHCGAGIARQDYTVTSFTQLPNDPVAFWLSSDPTRDVLNILGRSTWRH